MVNYLQRIEKTDHAAAWLKLKTTYRKFPRNKTCFRCYRLPVGSGQIVKGWIILKKRSLTKVLACIIAAVFIFAGCGVNNGAASKTASASSSTAQSSAAAAGTSEAGTAAEATPASDSSWDKVREKGEFVLGLDESFPPMGYRDEKNNIVGYDVDLAQEVANRLGVKLKLQPINWDTKEQELNTGNIDCIWNGFTITKEREGNVLFSEPYMNNQQILVVLEDSKYKTLADLKDKSVALQAASSAADALNGKADFKSTLREVVELKDNNLCLMDLKTGNVDAVAMDEVVARYYIKMKSEKYRVLDEGLSYEQYGIGFRKTDVQLMTKVNDTLKEIARDGKMAEISNKWFGKDISIIK
jgi:polar amino acid transport system substrate-binding protein